MGDLQVHERHGARVLALKAGLLALWAGVSFGGCFYARDLQALAGHWPFAYWMGAQGIVLVFIAIVAGYAWAMRRLAPDEAPSVGDAGDA